MVIVSICQGYAIRVTFLLVGILLCLSGRVECLQDTIRIGSFFEDEQIGPRLALHHALDEINLSDEILSRKIVIYDSASVKPDDSFEANKKVCKEVREGIAAIFGPVSPISAGHVQSICNSLSIPHIQAHWDPRDARDYYSINLYPDYMALSAAYKDLVEHWRWKAFTVLYEDNDGLIRLQDVLKASNAQKITVRKLPTDVNDYKHMFKALVEHPMKGDNRIIVDCPASKVGAVLKEAQRVNMVSGTFHYLFTTLDLGLVDLEDYKYGGANITAMRLLDPENPKVQRLLNDWVFELMNKRPSPLQDREDFIPVNTALMYDAAYLFGHALTELYKIDNLETTPLSCNKVKVWTDGVNLLNYLKAISFDGLTGPVHFQNGKRSVFTLDVVELTMSGLKKIGSWDPAKGVNITKTYKETQKEVLNNLENKTLTVVVAVDKPYVYEIEDEHGGPTRYEGFCIDLLKNISKTLKFDFKIFKVPGNVYGGCSIDENTNNQICTGMVKELVNHTADMAVAGMTITYEREQVIDFTKPFLNLGITILYKKPEPEPPKLFSFMDPFSTDVWMYMIAGYLCVSFMLFVIARFTPYEWVNPHPCNQDSDTVENNFSILNSLWFTIGSLMQQGCDIAPSAVSTRMVAGIWWFFTLIMISSYTANLAAFLTVERMVSDINSAEDLAKQTKIKYGTLNSGSTKEFFKRSQFPIYQRMWSFMESDSPSPFVDNSTAGIERVKKGNYAYFGESSFVEYIIDRECELMQVGGWLDSKGYGIALPRDSPFRDQVSSVILQMQEAQEIQRLKNIWWKEKYGGGKCLEDASKKTTNALGVKNVGGVFVVMIGGVVSAVFIALCEFIWKARKNAREDKNSLCTEIVQEFRFALKCFGASTKTLNRKPSEEIIDNGLQFMPLAGGNVYGQNTGKEIYT